MPMDPTIPGVYITEAPSAPPTITGRPTSIAAFVGRTWRGPLDEPVTCFNFGDYERVFGGLWRLSSVAYAIQQFFSNGGTQAIVVRTAPRTGAGSEVAATIDLGGGNTLSPLSPGTWGRNLVATVDHHTTDPALFNLTVVDDDTKSLDSARKGGSGVQEFFRGVSVDPTSSEFITTVLSQQSLLVRARTVGATRPAVAASVAASATSDDDGTFAANAAEAAMEIQGTATAQTGIYALLTTDIFNLLCIPPLVYTDSAGTRQESDVTMSLWSAAATLCKERRALLLVDAPSGWSVSGAASGVNAFSAIARDFAALYFPRLRINDPMQHNQPADFAPCGVMAGVISRTDVQRGVWKAPAGQGAGLMGVLGTSIAGLPAALSDSDSAVLNPLGINCLRTVPTIGPVAWGARTLAGDDALTSEWKYIPVRRLALYIEESLSRGTQWVVFEPNDEPLWATIRATIGTFMHSLYAQGALQGHTPRDAYFVKCDTDTTTQNDRNLGIVNILVGFAPLKPAEFIIIRIQQRAGTTPA